MDQSLEKQITQDVNTDDAAKIYEAIEAIANDLMEKEYTNTEIEQYLVAATTKMVYSVVRSTE